MTEQLRLHKLKHELHVLEVITKFRKTDFINIDFLRYKILVMYHHWLSYV